VVIDTSTISPSSARRFAQQSEAHGVSYLDAPVSGGQQGAESGTLSCMIGGPAAIVDALRDLLAAFCRTVTHVGEVGAGQTVKACNQVAAAGALLGVADAISLARSQGVDPDVMREVLLGGTGRSFVLDKDGRRIIDNEFTPGFRAHLMRKDLRIALKTAADGGAWLHSTQIAERLLDGFCEGGGAQLDWAGMARHMHHQRPD
jgi:2-hydroxy-3-oxopropionate reductase